MSDDMRVKSLPFEVKAVNAKDRIIEGYAAVFGNVDSYGDRIMPGAFAKTLSESASRVKVLWMHDRWEPIGKPVEMREDATGLFTRSYISKTPEGDKALTLAEDGVVDEMSIGYRLVAKKYQDNDWGGLDLFEVALVEYSFVTFASNPLARVSAVKTILESLSPDDRASLRDLLGTEPVMKATQPPGVEAGEPDIHSQAVKAAIRDLMIIQASARKELAHGRVR